MEQDNIPHEDEIFGTDQEWMEGKKQQAECEDSIHAHINKVCAELSLEETEHLPVISGLNLPDNWPAESDIKYFKSTASILPVTVIACYYDTDGSIYYDDASLSGLIELNKNYPSTFLHKEHFRDRLVSLIHKTDIDFKEQAKFSSAFHLVSSDSELIKYYWENKPLDLLADFPTLELIIKDRYCFYRLYENGLNDKQITAFIAATKILVKILG